MTVINGTFPGLANNGRVVAVALQTITEGNNIYPAGLNIAIATIGAGGAFTITVPSTEATGVQVRFRIEQGTAAPYTLIDTIDRVVQTATPVQFSVLIDSYYSPGMVDTSNKAIADLLAGSSSFLAAVPGFTEKTWTTTETFTLGQYTFRGDGLFRYISATASSNVDPLIAANVVPSAGAKWERKLTVPIGAGGSTNVRVYDQTIFETLTTEPASRKNLNELRAAIAAPNLTNYAQINTAQSWTGKQTFGAGASGITGASGASTTDLATNAFVQQELTTHRMPVPIVDVKMTSHPPITLGVNNITFNSEDLDPLNAFSSTDFIVPTGGGNFEFDIILGVRWNGNLSSAGQARVITRVFLYNFTAATELGDFWLQDQALSAQTVTNRFHSRRRVTSLTAGHVLVVRLSITLGGSSVDSPAILGQSIETASGSAQNQLRIWRTY